VIRLGSLAGYAFEGPRVLAGWTPPDRPAVYAIMCPRDPERRSQEYAVIYIGHSEDLSTERFPFRHPAAARWIRRAGSKWDLHVAVYEVPGGLPSHRQQIARELIAVYRPSCNTERYDQTWREEWIGEYQAPTTAPLTTGRTPEPSEVERPDGLGGDQASGR
jgi:hypothetical protein